MAAGRALRGVGVAIGVLIVVAGISLGIFSTLALVKAVALAVSGGLLLGFIALFSPFGAGACDQLPASERLSVGGIWLQTGLRATVRALLLPGAWLTVISVAAYGVLQLSKTLNRPELWGTKSNWNWVLVAFAVPAFLGSALVSIGYPRLLRRVDKDAELLALCANTAGLTAEKLQISPRKVAVHVWRVRGFKGCRYLDRRAAYRSHTHPKTHITWRKGKGALGVCWAEDVAFVGDGGRFDRQNLDKNAFCQLDPRDRFGLSWREYQRLKHYRAVLVVPLHGGAPGRYSLRGIFAVGVLDDGKVNDLNALRNDPELLNVLSVCEAALAGAGTTGT